MGLSAGSLRHRVTVLDLGPVERTAVGQAKREWVDRESRFARVEDLSAGMTYKAAMAGSRARTMVTMREPLEVKATTNAIRFEERGRTRILVVVDVRRRPTADYVEVFCTEIPPSGSA